VSAPPKPIVTQRVVLICLGAGCGRELVGQAEIAAGRCAWCSEECRQCKAPEWACACTKGGEG
jgi:hypothetical protein